MIRAERCSRCLVGDGWYLLGNRSGSSEVGLDSCSGDTGSLEVLDGGFGLRLGRRRVVVDHDVDTLLRERLCDESTEVLLLATSRQG